MAGERYRSGFHDPLRRRRRNKADDTGRVVVLLWQQAGKRLLRLLQALFQCSYIKVRRSHLLRREVAK